MSIIHDALKKTQNLLKEKKIDPITPEEKPKVTTPALQDKKPNNKVLFLLLAATFIMVAVLLVAFSVRRSFPPLSAGIQMEETIPPPSAQPSEPIEEAPAQEVQEPPPAISLPTHLTLTGIVAMNNGKYAVINEKLLTVGDQIEGWEIIAIHPKEVELSNQGQIFTLTHE